MLSCGCPALLCGYRVFLQSICADTKVYFHLYTLVCIHMYHPSSAHRSSFYVHVYMDYRCGGEEVTISRLPELSGLFWERGISFLGSLTIAWETRQIYFQDAHKPIPPLPGRLKTGLFCRALLQKETYVCTCPTLQGLYIWMYERQTERKKTRKRERE